MFHMAVAQRAGVDGKENHAVIRYLVDLYGPRLVLTPHQKRLDLSDRPSLYEGKSVLHQAILAHDVKLAQFFVERGADVHARCIGSFFGAASHAYYGEYPLSFAVCTGQKEVVRYLAENGALVNEDHDVHCCYALHMAVMSDRIASTWGGRGLPGGMPSCAEARCVARASFSDGLGRLPCCSMWRLVVPRASLSPQCTAADHAPPRRAGAPQCTTSSSTSWRPTAASSTSAAKRWGAHFTPFRLMGSAHLCMDMAWKWMKLSFALTCRTFHQRM